MVSRAPAILVLEDGRTFHGDAYGAEGETFGEAVFNTGMSGYQETLTDPSYHRQVVVMTAPHIGNTGMNDDDPESRRIWVERLRRARPGPGAQQLAVGPDPRRRPARSGRGRHQRRRHPRADPPPARARCHAGRHLDDRDRPGAPARARPRLRGDDRGLVGRGGHDASALRRRADRDHRALAAAPGRRPRPRHQDQHPADAGRARHRGARAAQHDHRRGGARDRTRRRLRQQRSR